MAAIVIAALSPVGHIEPLLAVAADQVDRGNTVTVLTGASHSAAIRSVGATPHPLPPMADFDDQQFDAAMRGRVSPLKAMNEAIVRLFLRPVPHQAAELSRVLAEHRCDAIIADYGFFGVLPMLLGDPTERPPVLYYTPTPLMLSSRDTAPNGLGLAPGSRLRNRALTVLSQRILLRRAQNAANAMLRTLGRPPLPVFLLDCGLLADRMIVPTVPDFEYPRSDLPAHVRFVGAVHPRKSIGFRPPPWWHELDGDRPVVHVTQGTVDNADLSRLIEPAIAALAAEPVTVVVTTCGGTLSGPVPANTRVADFLPHDVLLPRVDVIVTNGGYGAVQRAVACGMPMVVAGSTEDKPEVAARVAWSGAGVNLRTGTPDPAMVRTAVREVLDDDRYLHRARELETAFARRDGLAEIAVMLDEVIAEAHLSSSR